MRNISTRLSEELLKAASSKPVQDLIALDGEYAAATPALLALAPKYRAALDAALDFTKPKFNETMRSGQANM